MTLNPKIANSSQVQRDLDSTHHFAPDRMPAAKSYHQALEYTNLMRLSIAEERPSRAIQNAAHAVEFALKAVMLNSGRDDGWIAVHVGRDLDRAMVVATSCGMPQPPAGFVELLPELSRYHNTTRNFGQARVLSKMTSEQIRENVVGMIERVGQIIDLKYFNCP